MIIYNVTVNIDHDVHAAWLKWMRETHIPDVMATGCFKESRFCSVMTDEDQGGVTYSIQYLAETEAHYDQYLKDFALKLQSDHQEKFGGKFAAFRTLLKMVEQF